MALETHTHFIYPPEYQSGDYEKNANKPGPKRWCIQLIGIGTATDVHRPENRVKFGSRVGIGSLLKIINLSH